MTVLESCSILGLAEAVSATGMVPDELKAVDYIIIPETEGVDESPIAEGKLHLSEI